ncbi:alpha/beta fold hydrolase [Nocardioides solisilvae]|uniref:alpha/beta fold hydrolase n=1 Tax=Nocardioides solisilvae TaxID=1542435 RepID=UPI0013A5A679|nr:alpha/beta hydrolase [Nocardioides solisilvae]
MPHVQANGLSFHVQVIRGDDASSPASSAASSAGPRPPVVMLHGLVIDNLSSWFYTLAHPLALTCDVHLYDLRGHGRTDQPPTGYGVDRQVDDLVALLDAWGLDEPVHLFGNSFGAVVALALANRHPERVASLFLVEAHFAVEGWAEHMAGSLALAAFGLDENTSQEWIENNADRKMSRLARRAERFLADTTLIQDLKEEQPIGWLPQISCPVRAMYGSESDILHLAEALETQIPGCELEIVPGTTHSLLTERSELVRERALEWMARQRAVATAGA